MGEVCHRNEEMKLSDFSGFNIVKLKNLQSAVKILFELGICGTAAACFDSLVWSGNIDF